MLVNRWAEWLSLTLRAQKFLFCAQFLDWRGGFSVTVTGTPSAQVTAFSRLGAEFDADLTTTVGLRGQQPQAPPRPPPAPPAPPHPPAPGLAADLGQIAREVQPGAREALNIGQGQLLSPQLCEVVIAFLTSFAAAADAVGRAAVAPLLAQLSSLCMLTSTGLSILVFGGFDIITGQLTYKIPHSAAEIERALRLPTLDPLLDLSVAFSATALFSVSLVFAASGVQQSTPLAGRLTPGRRRRAMLQAPPPPPDLPHPSAWMSGVGAFLAAANASVDSQELTAIFSPLGFTTLSVGIWTGVAERETLRFDAILQRPWWGGSPLFQASAAAVVGGGAFWSIGVTVSLNEALTVSLARKGAGAGAEVRPLPGTGARG